MRTSLGDHRIGLPLAHGRSIRVNLFIRGGYVSVVQRLELWSVKPGVTGSNPVGDASHISEKFSSDHIQQIFKRLNTRILVSSCSGSNPDEASTR